MAAWDKSTKVCSLYALAGGLGIKEARNFGTRPIKWTDAAEGEAMNKYFTVDARAVLTLGRDSIRDHTTAILELVKNAYDADASVVEVEIRTLSPKPFIRISDNGIGMTEGEVESNWLRIGYSAKNRERMSSLQRRKTGEKGVGRLSADRLGAHLRLISKAEDASPIGLKISWEKFDAEGEDISKIPIQTLENPTLSPPKAEKVRPETGTELYITSLRQGWRGEDIEALKQELATLTPPWKDMVNFDIRIFSDVAPHLNGPVQSSYEDAAALRLDARFEEGIFTYRIRSHDEEEASVPETSLPWSQLLPPPAYLSLKRADVGAILGPLSLTLLYFPRKSDSVLGTGMKLSDLRSFLNQNMGIKIYRDNIRVRPYGDPNLPEGDWLGLAARKGRDPAGAARGTFKVGANQMLGAVFITRDMNPNLKDGTSREGLIQMDAFEHLKDLVTAALRLLETERHVRFLEEKKEKAAATPLEHATRLTEDFGTFRQDLAALQEELPEAAKPFAQLVMDRVETLKERIEESEELLDEFETQNRLMRGLATLGIVSAAFGHQTKKDVDTFQLALVAADGFLGDEPPEIPKAQKALATCKKTAKRIATWGDFALSRTRSSKRRRGPVSVNRLIETIVQDLRPLFAVVNIEIEAQNLEEVSSRTFEMDLETILMNLLTNAYDTLLHSTEDRTVRIALTHMKREDKPGFALTVSDSGHGVASALRSKIWLPLFTTKKEARGWSMGTGLGLYVVDMIMKDLKGHRDVDTDPLLKGARFILWFPKGKE